MKWLGQLRKKDEKGRNERNNERNGGKKRLRKMKKWKKEIYRDENKRYREDIRKKIMNV